MNDYRTWSNSCKIGFPKMSKWDIDPRKPKMNSFRKTIKRHLLKARKDQTYIWAIFEKKSGFIIGLLDIHIIERDILQKANLGYRIFNNYWRQGFAHEAIKKLVKKCLIDLKLNRLEAVIDLDNIASICLMKRLNYRCEGVRKNYWYQEGRWDDQMVYIIDRKELKLPRLKIYK